MKKAKFVILSIVVALFVVILLLPTFFSTSWGKQILSTSIQPHLRGTLEIKSLSLSWFGSQKAQGILITDETNKPLLTCSEISSTASLWSLLFFHDFKDTVVVAPELQLIPTSPAFKPSTKTPSTKPTQTIKSAFFSFSLPFIGHLKLQKGKITVVSSNTNSVSFEEVFVDVSIPSSSSLQIDVKASSKQKEILGELSLLSTIEFPRNASPHASLDAHAVNLPLEGIDQLVSLFKPEYSGLLLESVGSSLNIDVKGTFSTSYLECSLQAKSPLISATLETQSLNGHSISLKSPGKVSYLFTPALASKLFALLLPKSQLALTGSANIDFSLSEVKIPLENASLNLNDSSFQMGINCSPASFSWRGQPFLNVDGIKSTLSAKTLKESVNFSLNTSAQIEKTYTTSLTLQSTLKELLSSDRQGTFSLSVQKLPLFLIDDFLGWKNQVTLLLGPVADLSLQGSLIAGQEAIGSCKITSPYLKTSDVSLHYKQGLFLEKTALLTYDPPFSLFEKWLPGVQPSSLSPLQFNVTRLTLPSLDKMQEIQVNADLSLAQASFTKFFSLSPFHMQQLKANLVINTLENISFQLQEKSLNAEAILALRDNYNKLVLKNPFKLKLSLTPEQVTSFCTKSIPCLTTPTQFILSIDPFAISLSPTFTFSNTLKGTLSSDQLQLATSDLSKKAFLQDAKLQFIFNPSGNNFEGNLDALVVQEDQQNGEIHLTAKGENIFVAQQAEWNASTLIQHLSLDAIETWLNQNLSLRTILGPTLDASIDVKSNKTMQTILFKADSNLLHLEGGLEKKESILHMLPNKKMALTLKVTPDSYSELDRLLTGQKTSSSPFRLNQPTQINLTFSTLSWPLSKNENALPKIAFDWSKFELVSNFQIKNLAFVEKKTSQLTELNNFQLNIQKNIQQTPLIFSMQGNVSSKALSSGQIKEGMIKAQGSFDQLFSSSNQFDLSHCSVQGNLTTEQFPSSVFDIVFRAFGQMDFPFTSLFGESVNVAFSSQIQDASGPVNLTLHSPNTRASLIGQLKKGTLSLNETAHAQVIMTPALSDWIFSKINPLSISGISAHNPLTLQIEPNGFSLPLFPFNLNNATIPHCRLELGQISCQNEGNITITLGLLKTAKLTDKNQKLNLWFAPIEFQVRGGTVDLERTEILVANTYDVATWGKIDLVNEYVDMVLGLTADCLQKALGIKGLPENYVLQIPLKGKLNDVKVNTSQATTKIAALMIWQKKSVAGAIAGGPAGALFGELLGKVATLPDIGSKAPPAKHPFPWEVQPQEPKKKRSHSKKKGIKKGDKPLKQLLKILR